MQVDSIHKLQLWVRSRRNFSRRFDLAAQAGGRPDDSGAGPRPYSSNSGRCSCGNVTVMTVPSPSVLSRSIFA